MLILATNKKGKDYKILSLFVKFSKNNPLKQLIFIFMIFKAYTKMSFKKKVISELIGKLLMLSSISGFKIPSLQPKKLNNQETKNLSLNIHSKDEEVQKLLYPDSALQKACFIPSFSSRPKVIDIKEQRERINSHMEKAVDMIKNADSVIIDSSCSNFPVSLHNVTVHSIQDNWGGFKDKSGQVHFTLDCTSESWNISKERTGLYLNITSEEESPAHKDSVYGTIPLSYTNYEKLLNEAKSHPLVKSLDKLEIKSTNLVNFMGTLSQLTCLPDEDPNKLHWVEGLDYHGNPYMRTKYKNYNVDLVGDIISGYQIEISKSGKTKSLRQPFLVFQNLDEDIAEHLDNAIHQSDYTRYEDTHEGRKDEKEYFEEIGKELGFLSGKTKKGKDKLIKLLEELGFERKKPDPEK